MAQGLVQNVTGTFLKESKISCAPSLAHTELGGDFQLILSDFLSKSSKEHILPVKDLSPTPSLKDVSVDGKRSSSLESLLKDVDTPSSRSPFKDSVQKDKPKDTLKNQEKRQDATSSKSSDSLSSKNKGEEIKKSNVKVKDDDKKNLLQNTQGIIPVILPQEFQKSFELTQGDPQSKPQSSDHEGKIMSFTSLSKTQNPSNITVGGVEIEALDTKRIPHEQNIEPTLHFGQYGATVIGTLPQHTTQPSAPLQVIAALSPFIMEQDIKHEPLSLDVGEDENLSIPVPTLTAQNALATTPPLLSKDQPKENNNPFADPHYGEGQSSFTYDLQEKGKIDTFANSIEEESPTTLWPLRDLQGAITSPLSSKGSSAFPMMSRSNGENASIDFHALYTKMAQSLKDAAELKNPTFHIRLTPEGWGEVQASISFEKKNVEVLFNLSSETFSKIGEQQKNEIKAIFEAQGFSCDENSLKFSMHNQSNHQQFQEQKEAVSNRFLGSNTNNPVPDPSSKTFSYTSTLTPKTFVNPHGTFAFEA